MTSSKWSNSSIAAPSGSVVIEYPGGYKLWVLDALHRHELHRLDGPAVTWPNGSQQWYIFGKEFAQHEFDQHPLVIFYRLTQALDLRK